MGGPQRRAGLLVRRPHRPYPRPAGGPAPIYAIPGNHDWYEDLGAFTRGFRADTPPLGPEPRPRPRPRPKILITGSPLYVDGEHHPCPIDGGGTVDDVVRDPEHHYVAAIGGDIHNYQRCPLRGDSLAFRSHLYARRNWTPPDRGRGRHPTQATP